MANAINAMKNITSDKIWFIKVAVLAIPVYAYLTEDNFIPMFFVTDLNFWVVLSLLYLGVSSVLIHRNLKNKVPILPSFFDIIDVIRRSICSAIVALPGLASLFAVLYLLHTYFQYLSENLMFWAHVLCILILLPFIIVPIVIYSVNGKLTDIFRVRNLQSASGDFIISFILFIIQYALTLGVFTYLVYAAFKSFYGENFIGIPILFAFVITFTFLAVFSWAADLYEQVIPAIEEKQRRDKALRETL